MGRNGRNNQSRHSTRDPFQSMFKSLHKDYTSPQLKYNDSIIALLYINSIHLAIFNLSKCSGNLALRRNITSA